MKRTLSALALLLALTPLVSNAQWGAALSIGSATPTFASNNAPPLRATFLGSLRVRYTLRSHPQWTLFAELCNLRHRYLDGVDVEAVPKDSILHADKYMFYPLLFGVDYQIPLTQWGAFHLHAAAGFHFHAVNCHRQGRPRHIIINELWGYGFALKAGADLLLWNHLSLGVSYIAMGNPFQQESEPLVGTPTKSSIITTQTRRYTNLDGYRQHFLTFSIGYWL